MPRSIAAGTRRLPLRTWVRSCTTFCTEQRRGANPVRGSILSIIWPDQRRRANVAAIRFAIILRTDGGRARVLMHWLTAAIRRLGRPNKGRCLGVTNARLYNWRALLRPVYHRLFRLHLRLRCWLADHFSGDAETPPLPPALLRYRVSESLSKTDFLNIGKGCAQHIEQQVADLQMDLAAMERILDFGCGCGRTLRWLLERNAATQFYGVDVDREAITWCKQHLSNGTFAECQPDPPLAFPSAHFDLVYCISVFTHLDERMQNLWLLELSRVLKPDGVLILTVHGKRAADAGHDQDVAAMLADSGFAHQRSRKLSGIVPGWYNTSWHSREYIVSKLRESFGEVRYVEVPDGSQDLVVARVPLRGARSS